MQISCLRSFNEYRYRSIGHVQRPAETPYNKFELTRDIINFLIVHSPRRSPGNGARRMRFRDAPVVIS